MMTVTRRGGGTVPPQALLLSLLFLWVPILSSSLFPDWSTRNVGLLVWLLALIPPFLLSYYRGWRGASLALAAGMAALAAAQVIVILVGAEPPPPTFLLGLTLVLIIVSMGSGVVASVFHRSLSEAEQMALTDPGTGLANRRHGMIHLQRAFAAADRGASLSVVLFDLDHFKAVNDRYGHATGDAVLRVFAQILRARTRAMHLAVRFGGEEFLVILDGSDRSAAALMAERVLADLRAFEFPCGQVTVSAGLSEYEPGMASPDVLVAAADQALYRAKAQGRDRVMVLDRQGSRPSMPVRVPTNTEAAAPVDGHGELVLVVDDDPAVLRVLARALRQRRYRPIETSDPVHALALARGLNEPIDLVITDLVMPAMSGFRLVEMLMEIQPQIRALYISGYSSDEVRWSGVPGTTRTFLPKPISIDALATAVRMSLETPLPRPDAMVDPQDDSIATNGRVGPAAQGNAVDDPIATDGRLHDRLAATTARLDEAYADLVLRLGWAAEYRDDTTGRHAQRVGTIAGLLARELNVAEALVGHIEQAAILHDIGKIAVPDSILNKPGGLTPTETEIIHRHCVIGAQLLAGSRHPLLQEAERVARSHHERWDGGGYPDGLEGEDIPLSARIVAVADTFDSMTHDRPYRTGTTPARAIAEIRSERGRQFDPGVVDALGRLADRGFLDRPDVIEMAGEWLGEPAPTAPPTAAATGTGYRTARAAAPESPRES